jgi:F-type H+-transporting ATPase subunit c
MESQVGLIAIAAGIAIGLGAFGAASGQGRAAAAAFEGIARNPSSKDDVFTPFLLGLAFMEFQAILSFIIAIMLVGKF